MSLRRNKCQIFALFTLKCSDLFFYGYQYRTNNPSLRNGVLGAEIFRSRFDMVFAAPYMTSPALRFSRRYISASGRR